MGRHYGIDYDHEAASAKVREIMDRLELTHPMVCALRPTDLTLRAATARPGPDPLAIDYSARTAVSIIRALKRRGYLADGYGKRLTPKGEALADEIATAACGLTARGYFERVQAEQQARYERARLLEKQADREEPETERLAAEIARLAGCAANYGYARRRVRASRAAENAAGYDDAPATITLPVRALALAMGVTTAAPEAPPEAAYLADLDRLAQSAPEPRRSRR